MNITLLLDDASLQALARIKDANAKLTAEIKSALDDMSEELLDDIPSEMNWQNPTGALEESFTAQDGSGYLEVGSEIPYSRRREFGFSGMTDSLGRTYYNDPGAFYLKSAIQTVDVNFVDRLSTAVDNALAA